MPQDIWQPGKVAEELHPEVKGVITKRVTTPVCR